MESVITIDDVSFPPVSIAGKFEEDFVSLYFHLTRNSSSVDVHGSLFSSLLETCTPPQLSMLCRLLAHTRDRIQGKGEQELAYSMIWQLNRFFPEIAMDMIRCFVLGASPYGSWRDIKHLCQYIRRKSKLGEEDPLISACILIANRQLKTDLDTWKYSRHAFSRDHISNVAKWIPREHKKFDWLYEKFVIYWTYQEFPVLFDTAFRLPEGQILDAYRRALCKAKRLYRKNISLLNKGLNTTEIRLCSNTTDKLLPREVSKFTLMKQPKLLFHKESAENFQQFYKKKYHFGEDPEGSVSEKSRSAESSFLHPHGWHTVLPFSYFVEKGLSLLRNDRSNAEVDFEIQLLNAQWLELLRMFPEKFDTVLPVVDVSFPMQHPDKESFYTAVGMAIFISETSTFGQRVLALDNLPLWINLETAHDFVSKLDIFDSETKSCRNTHCNFIAGMELIIDGLRASNMTRNFINDLELVLFSNFYQVNLHAYSISELYVSICTVFSKLIDSRSYPRVVFWNLNKGDIQSEREHLFSPRTTGDKDPLFCATNPRLRFFSGFSPFLFRGFYDTKRSTAYESICQILDQERYRVLDSILPLDSCKMSPHNV
jgi:hypothetical protein